jgi:hypothetical protein
MEAEENYRRENVVKLHITFVAGLCLLAVGPVAPARAAGADDLYARITDTYMTGKFEELDAALGDAAKRMKDFSAEQKTDVLYVRKALAECRPAWWTQTQKGRKTRIRQVLWGKRLNTVWDPQAKGIQMKTGRFGTEVTVGWKPEEMDSTAKGMYGYLQGDMTCVNIWSSLTTAQVWGGFPLQTLASMSERDKLRLNRYLSFRSNLTALYYCTPPGRRYALHIYFASFFYDNWGKGPASGARRAVGAMFMGEVLKDPSLYPSAKLPGRLSEKDAEEALGHHYKYAIKRGATWTIAEDRRFREALKPFAAANNKTVFKTEKVVLPNKLVFAIDVKADEAYRAKRDAWVKQQFDKAKAGGG